MSLIKWLKKQGWFAKDCLRFVYVTSVVCMCMSLIFYSVSDYWVVYIPAMPNIARLIFVEATRRIAVTLFYFCGLSAWILLGVFWIFFYWFVWLDRRWQDEWERVVSCLVLVCMMDFFCAINRIILCSGTPCVGFFGRTVYCFCTSFIRSTGELYCIVYVVSLCCFVVLLRCYGVRAIAALLHCVYEMVRDVIHAVYARYIVTITTRCVVSCRGYIYQASSVCKQSVRAVCSVNRITRVPDDYRLVQQEFERHFGGGIGDRTYGAQQDGIGLYQSTVKNDELIVHQPIKKSSKRVAPAASSGYQCPSSTYFVQASTQSTLVIDEGLLRERGMVLEEKLEKFGVFGSIVSIKSGPVVALFEYQPRIDIKLSKILTLEDDLALALQALSIRIIAPIPGTSVVGFEVAHKKRTDVPFSGLIQSPVFTKCEHALPIVLGQDTVGGQVIVDLARMPHLLMAGSTGSGKSVALNCILMSLLCKFKPDELQLVLIDPKRLEFASYVDLAHLLFPVVIDPKKVAPILRWVIAAMEERYDLMAQAGVRNIHDYNNAAHVRAGKPRLPFIVVIIDELADLMITTGREIEDLIARIAQMARAAGIHLIVATQRPSVDVITGLIKVNFPSRISFRVASKIDSRIILDEIGADKLLGRGDMLFLDSTGIMKRVHGAYVTDEHIQEVCNHIRRQQPPTYQHLVVEPTNGYDDISDEDEELYRQILLFLDTIDEVSISLLQRKFKIGYNRSARFIEMFEERGLIMPSDGGKPRKIIR